MENLTQQIVALKERAERYTPEGAILYTVDADSTGDLMASCMSLNCDLVKPFRDSKDQDYYYFTVPVKKGINIKVKGTSKISFR